MNDYLILENLNFYEPITIFNDDLLVLDFKHNKVLVLNKDGMVINTYQFEVENNEHAPERNVITATYTR